MKTRLFPSFVVVLNVFAFSLCAMADIAKVGEGSGDYVAGSSLFSVRVQSDGRMIVKDAQSPLIIRPDSPPARSVSSEALLNAWRSYYHALLNGDRAVLEKYAEQGSAPGFASRAYEGTADLIVVTAAERGGAVRLILRWTLQAGNNTSKFYDCHIWREVNPGDWKVKSMLFEK